MKLFIVHSVSQRPDLGHLSEPLGRTESLLVTVGFKKTMECVCARAMTNKHRTDYKITCVISFWNERTVSLGIRIQ